MSDNLRLCFSYAHTDAPADGSNSFVRALRGHLSQSLGVTIVDDLHGQYDVLFTNQLSRAPGSRFSVSEIRALLNAENSRKLVVRAINLSGNYEADMPSDLPFRTDLQDQPILELLNLADFVIFQSAFQKTIFGRSGFKGDRHSVVHNGAASVFSCIPAKVKKLTAEDSLILVSAAMSTIGAKRHDIIARLSLIPGVKVIHAGVWPQGLDSGKVELAGVLSHDEMAKLYARSHYFLHPAVRDVCPNSLIEGLCAGLPSIYNPGPGSGAELGNRFGIALDENDLPGTISRARGKYEALSTALIPARHYFSIERAASSYLDIFKEIVRSEMV
jgi:glycosyltransferase involved in cell wall biosynthesis